MRSGLDVKIFLWLQAAGVEQDFAAPLAGAFHHHLCNPFRDRFLMRQRIPFRIDFYVRQRGVPDEWSHELESMGRRISTRNP